MKAGIIIIAIAALALAVFATQEVDARGNSGLKLRFAGSNFITSSTDEGRPTPQGAVSTSLQSGIVKGTCGKGVFTAQTIIEETGLDARCTPLFGADLSTTIVVTYNDGSILSLVTGEDSFYCTDGSSFFVDFEGTTAGGDGRFEGIEDTGTWRGSAESNPTARVIAEATVDLGGLLRNGCKKHDDDDDSDTDD